MMTRRPLRSSPWRYARPVALLCATSALVGCNHDESSGPASSGPARTWRMGFSAIPPRNDQTQTLASLDVWTNGHADAAIMHVSPPWAAMLAGFTADTAVRSNELQLANFYRAKHLRLVVTIDVTDGLNRAAEAPELVAAHRSITEPAVQQMYRNYVRAIARIVGPDELGLAAETNLIRAAAPKAVYDAVVKMTNDAAADLRTQSPSLPLYVSVQVEVAWGRLGIGGNPTFVGVAQDFTDFPFITELGLSSYPFLAGFIDPDDLPLDYYARVPGGRVLPLLVVEGGWSSASVGGVVSSPSKQARYLAKQARMLDSAKATALFQLTFTDLDLANYPPQPPGSVLQLFAALGMVDADLHPKPAFTVWDSLFAVPRR